MTKAGHGGHGLFISFEGTEGSGKSTQLKLLTDRLRSHKLKVIVNQEPGGTAIGKQIRRILLDPANQEMAPMTELLLMFASRCQAAAELIRPALEQGEIVVTDRFTDSTLAYQGEARGLGFPTVLETHRLALNGLVPDLTICLVVDLESGLRRARFRNERLSESGAEDRIDQEASAFHGRVLDGYRKLAELEPRRFRLVRGEGSPEDVAERVWAEAEPLISSRMQE